MEQYDDLIEALNAARETENRPNWLMRQYNKVRVAGILAEELSRMNDINKAVTAYNRYLKAPGDKGYDGTKLDDFYHKRAMYRAAQLGADAALFAFNLGEFKENNYDWPRNKYVRGWNDEKNEAERQKDLQNNKNAIIMALKNPGVPVEQMVPHAGTTAGVWDSRFRK